MRKGLIYTLIDPRTNLVRYVGQTVSKPNYRYAQHIFQWKRCPDKMTHVNSWIKNLYDLGLKPIMEIIEQCVESELDNKEIQVIKYFKALGANLCNHSHGGKGVRGVRPTKESSSKRLETLKTSTAWKERHIRHSHIMKEKHKKGETYLGFSHLSAEDRLKVRHKITESLKQPVMLLHKETGQILTFKSRIELGLHFKCSHSAVTDFIYGRRNSRKFKDYYLTKAEMGRASKK